MTRTCLLAGILLLSGCVRAESPSLPPFDEVDIAGEVGPDEVILQSRLQRRGVVEGEIPGFGDFPGYAGWGRFEVSTDSLFSQPVSTPWQEAAARNDFILKAAVRGLAPGRRYWYRVRAGRDTGSAVPGRVARFRTLPSPEQSVPVNFALISCMNYEHFYGLGSIRAQHNAADWVKPAVGEDRRLGYPAFEALLAQGPEFWISNGDNVYYDHPSEQPEHHARTQREMRAKWHRQFSMARFRLVADQIPAFFMKDDHDYRFNDADTTNAARSEPSHALGISTFREQVPVVPPDDPGSPTYRTVRVGRHLQLWLLEGRDYRSPNAMPDGPQKSVWGVKQKAWLMRTLLESDATFKIIVSPTPIVGPDDASKEDNAADPDGFQYEGRAFLDWMRDHQLVSPHAFLVTGDRHWQYHSIDPTGIEEFSTGTFVSQNARLGRSPGQAKSSDPTGRITQPYLQPVPVGGFLEVRVDLDAAGNRPSIVFEHWGERGKLLDAVRRYADSPS